MKPLYTASAVATGDGRNGHVRTLDGLVDTPVRTPKELGGAGDAPNPELLFAAGYAACFHSALRLAAKKFKADVTDSEVVADVSLKPSLRNGFTLGVELEVSLPNVDEVTARRIIDRAHELCPYSNAIRGNVDVELSVA